MKALLTILCAIAIPAWANPGNMPVSPGRPGTPGSGDSPVPLEKVKLAMNLSVMKCTAQGNGGPCIAINYSTNSPDVVLVPVSNSSGVGEAGHTRGSTLALAELDGFRYIGIVTIDKFEYVNESGVKAFDYFIQAEILNGRGTVGKMSLSVASMDAITPVNLTGMTETDGAFNYSANLSIGPCIPNTGMVCTNSSGGAKWNVILGSVSPLL